MAKSSCDTYRVADDETLTFWKSPDEAFFNRKTTAKVLGKSKGWLDQAAINGGGPVFRKLGRHCFYQKRDVLAWLDECMSPRLSSSATLAGGAK